MSQIEKLETSAFIPKIYEKRRRLPIRRQSYYSAASSYRKKSRRPARGSGALMICAFVCLGALCAALVGTQQLQETARDLRAVLTGNLEYDKEFGKLKFVQEDDALSVFGSRKAALGWPLEGEMNDYDQQKGRRQFVGESECDVYACARGTVMQAGEGSITIEHEEFTTVYEGLSYVAAEVGQSVVQGAAIGRAGQDGGMYLGLLKQGEACDPVQEMDVKK